MQGKKEKKENVTKGIATETSIFAHWRRFILWAIAIAIVTVSIHKDDAVISCEKEREKCPISFQQIWNMIKQTSIDM